MQENWIGKSRGLRLSFAFRHRAAGGVRRGPGGLHHPPRHPVRRQLRRRGRRSSPGAGFGRSRCGHGRLHRRLPPRRRHRGRDRDGRKARARHRPAGAPSRSTGPHPARLGRQLHPDGLRHRRDLRLPGARPARPGLRPQIRPAGSGRWCCRPARRRRPSPSPTKPIRGLGASSIRTSSTAWRWRRPRPRRSPGSRAMGAGPGRHRLPAARLGRVAATLLGLPDPGDPLRRLRASAGPR